MVFSAFRRCCFVRLALRWSVLLAVKVNRKQVRQRRVSIAAGVESFRTTQSQQRPAASKYKLLDCFKLVERKEGRLYTSDHQGIVLEQLLFGFWKPVDQFVGVIDPLPIEFPVSRPQN